MTSRIVTLASLLDEVRRSTRESMYCALPASIVAYTPATQRADVKPQLKHTVRDALENKELVEDLPILCDVPIMFQRFGGFMLTMPVAVGDTVLLVFTDRSIDKWKTNGGNVDPIDLRAHDISDAVAIPGLYPGPEALPSTLTTGLAIGKEGDTTLQIHIDGTSINLGGPGAVEFVALSQKVEQNFAYIAAALKKIASILAPSSDPTPAAVMTIANTVVVTDGSPGATMAAPFTATSVAATKAKAL